MKLPEQRLLRRSYCRLSLQEARLAKAAALPSSGCSLNKVRAEEATKEQAERAGDVEAKAGFFDNKLDLLFVFVPFE